MTFNEIFSVIEFRQPLWFALLGVPFMAVVIDSFRIDRSLPSTHFDSAMRRWYINHTPALFSSRRKVFVISLLFWLFAAITLAGPEYPDNSTLLEQKTGDTLMVMLDVSATMNSTDESPSRLLRAKTELMILADNLEHGDSMGVILYAGTAHLLFHPTSDKEVIQYFLNQIKPNILPVAGSKPELAIALATQILLQENRSNNYLLLITDGDSDQKNQILNTISKIVPSFPVFTLGVGRAIETPVPSKNTDKPWITNDNAIITSNIDESFLETIAKITNGQYHTITDDQSDLEFLYKEGIKSDHASRREPSARNWVQLYHPFLLVSLLLFLYRSLFFTEG